MKCNKKTWDRAWDRGFMIPLEPCPICGGEAIMRRSVDEDFALNVNWRRIRCVRCGAHTAYYRGTVGLAKEWNSRKARILPKEEERERTMKEYVDANELKDELRGAIMDYEERAKKSGEKLTGVFLNHAGGLQKAIDILNHQPIVRGDFE